MHIEGMEEVCILLAVCTCWGEEIAEHLRAHIAYVCVIRVSFHFSVLLTLFLNISALHTEWTRLPLAAGTGKVPGLTPLLSLPPPAGQLSNQEQVQDQLAHQTVSPKCIFSSC